MPGRWPDFNCAGWKRRRGLEILSSGQCHHARGDGNNAALSTPNLARHRRQFKATQAPSFLAAHVTHMSKRNLSWRSKLALWCALLVFGIGAVAAVPMGAADAAKVLGDLRDGNRFNAIANLARSGQLHSPLSAADCAAILQGTTQSSRAAAIGELAPLVKADLVGQEAATILGPAATLSEGNRFNAIAALARAKRFGPSIGEDAALALIGSTQSSRATAIGELAPYLRTGMSGQAIATVLGPAAMLSDGNRFNAVAAIARQTKRPAVLAGSDGAAILQGAIQSSRAAAIGELAALVKSDLNGQEAEAILGSEAILSEGNRFNAIAALARAKRFGPSIGEDAALALKGATQSSRAAAIGEIAPYLRVELSGQAIATVLGPPAVLTDGNRYNAIAAIVRTARKLATLSSADGEAILQGTTQSSRTAAVGELARFFKADLTGYEAAAILGTEAVLSDGNRYNAISALANAGKLRAGLSADEIEVIVHGTTGQARISAIAVIASATKQQNVATPLPIGGAPSPSSTAGTTPTAAASASRLPPPGSVSQPASPTVGATSAMAGAGVGAVSKAKFVVEALGKQAANGGSLELSVPVNVGVEVTLSARPQLFTNDTYSWIVDGASAGDGLRIANRLAAGDHVVEARAMAAGTVANSTPSTMPTVREGTPLGRITVKVSEVLTWSCLGRLGSGCNDDPFTNLVTTSVAITLACRGKADQFCVSSAMSAGAIKHDKCCEERKAKGGAPGRWCDNNSAREDPKICAAEWDQAVFDSKGAELPILDLLVPSFARKRFTHTWIYPPDGSDRASSGGANWWQRLASSGVIISYSNAQPDRVEQSICMSGSASKQRIGGMENTELAVGPILSKTHAWICN